MPEQPQVPLRADAQRSVLAILHAADAALSRDASATLDQIAREAGVARATLYRRFTSREDLLAHLTRWTTADISAAIGPVEQLVIPTRLALHAVTERILTVKVSWPFTSTLSARIDPQAQRTYAEIAGKVHTLLRSAQEHRVLAPDVCLDWARRVYYALVETTVHDMAAQTESQNNDPTAMATRLIDAFLGGLEPAPGPGRVGQTSENG